MTEHVDRALLEPFPLSIETPLPAHTVRAAVFVRDSPPDAVASFWSKQLQRLSALVKNSHPLQERWNRSIPPSLAPAAGKLNTVALSQLMDLCGIAGQRWVDQFAFGFPITGVLSQKHSFDPSTPEADILSHMDLYRSAAQRFRDRAARSGYKNAPALWDEAISQHNLGWLSPPIPLNADGRPTTWHSPHHNVAFRFGVEQAEKLRACDDLRHSLTNLACHVATPIQLVSWDHISELSSLLNNHRDDWEMLKADHEAAYKQLPMAPSDQDTAVIALRCPLDGLWYGFASRTLVFGSIAAVLHYNIFSRVITDLVNQLFGIPLVCFFDDFASLMKRLLSDAALGTFTEFCSLLGISLKALKSEAGPDVTFLGLRGSFPCLKNNFELSVRLGESKRSSWISLIDQFLKSRTISHQELEKLIGRFSFSQTILFGKFARAQLRPLYRKLHSKFYSGKLAPHELDNLSWWRSLLAVMAPRSLAPRPKLVPWIAYTDAATSSSMLCALLFDTSAPVPTIHRSWTARPNTTWDYLFRNTARILGLELLAILAFIEDFAPKHPNSCVWIYVDNNNALAAIVRGDSPTDIVAIMVARLWETLTKHNVHAWFSRVRSKLNPADLPTRGKNPPFETRKCLPFPNLKSLLITCRRALRLLSPLPRRTRLEVKRVRNP